MKDMLITLVILFMFISPFLFKHLKQRKASFFNFLTLLAYGGTWIWILSNGNVGLNLGTVLWWISLIASVLFLLTSYTILLKRNFSLSSLTVLSIGSFSAIFATIFIVWNGEMLSTSVIADYLISYATPVYMLCLLFNGLIKNKLLVY